MAKHLINIHSNEFVGGGAKLPDPQVIEYGEIAVNYADSAETIAIRNENDEIVEFKPHKYYGPVLSGLSEDIAEITDFLYPKNELNKAGTLIYTKNDGKYYAVAADEWSDDLGTQVGVIVIPQGILPDGKARIMGIKGVDSAGTLSDTEVSMPWGGRDVDVEGLTNYNKVPVVDPETNEITGKTSASYLPSDKFTTRPNPLDIGTAWNSSSYSCAPSPYKDGALNPAYCATEYTGDTIANCFSDFSGLENTQFLCQSADTYTAANAAHLYKAFDGDALEWYLPAMGELGFILPRFNAINEALASVGGVALASSYNLWSSSEYSSSYARGLNTYNGDVYDNTKSNSYRVRPFARLDFIIFSEEDNLDTRIQSYTESKQDRTDDSLSTESKEITGAINEIATYVGLDGGSGDRLKAFVRECIKEYLSGTLNQISLTESGDTLSVGFSEDAIFGEADGEY